MPEPMELFLMLLFSAIGMGYFIYGKKQGKAIPLLAGIGLMGYTYFLSNRIAVILVGLALTALPILFRN